MKTARQRGGGSGDPALEPPPPAELAYARRVLIVMALAGFFTALSTSTLSVAIPVVVRHYHAGSLAATWIVLAPSLTGTVLMLSFGRLGDMLGRRIVILCGMVCFTAGSLLLGFAPTDWSLVGLQVVQAIGTAAIWANGAAILADGFPRAKLSEGLGIYFAAFSVAQLIGPSVGGGLVESAGWRWIFWINVPVGIACTFFGRATLRSEQPAARGSRLDYRGSLLVLAGLAGLILSFTQTEQVGWANPQVYGGVAASLLLLVAFVALEHRTRDPLIDLAIFRNRSFSLGVMSAFVNGMAQASPAVLMALFFQAVEGNSPLEAGLKVTPLAIANGCFSASAGLLLRFGRPRALAVVGSAISFSGLTLLAATVGTNYGVIVVGLVVVGIGAGTFQPNNANAVMDSAPPDKLGLANGARLTVQNVGWVISTALCLTIITAPLAPRLRQAFFAGTASSVSHASALALEAGYHHAFTMLSSLALAGTAAAFASWRYARPADQ